MGGGASAHRSGPNSRRGGRVRFDWTGSGVAHRGKARQSKKKGVVMSSLGSGDHISATISGTVSGQVAVGKDIAQTQHIGAPAELSEEERLAPAQAFTDVQDQIRAAAPPEMSAAALERLGELEEAVGAPEPDLSTMEYVRGWFTKNLPSLAGAVTGIVVHPAVGKMVSAAGEALAAEFKRRFAAH